MDKTRLQFPPIALQWPQQSRDGGIKQRREQSIQLHISTSPFLPQVQDVAQPMGEELFPAIEPSIILRDVSIVGHAVEAKLSIRRRAALMKLGQTFAKWFRIRHPWEELMEGAEVEMCMWVTFESSPCDWRWTKVGYD